MSTPVEDIEAALEYAMTSVDAESIISGVKNAVARELELLSPDASIVFTSYYNHTYMPDIVLEWGERKAKTTRPIYLRTNLRPEPVAHEVESLASQDPVVLGLNSPQPEDSMSRVRERARQSQRVLVTDVRSLGHVGSPPDGGPQGPLMQLVQTNLLQSGRGLFTGEDATRLSRDAKSIELGTVDGGLSLERFRETAGEVFAPDGVLRLVRASQLLQSGLDERGLSAFLEAAHGQLSDSELRIVLPYLLSNPNVTKDTGFWSLVGSMMDLADLEAMSTDLEGLDMTHLVAANLPAWKGKRAQLGFFADFDEDESEDREDPDATYVERPDPDSIYLPSWTMVGGRLTGFFAGWKLQLVASDSRRLRGRDGGREVLWDDISLAVSRFNLYAVELRGISRRVYVSAERSGDVKSDVRMISESLQDSFRVTDVAVLVPGSDSINPVEVDFNKMTATSVGGLAPLADLAATALTLLGFRNPIEMTWIDDRLLPPVPPPPTAPPSLET